jgi:hypothetical protein
MSLKRLLIVALAILSSLAWAAEDEHRHDHESQGPSHNGALIRITINPEARVSVTSADSLPASVPCGFAAEIPVRIVNQGFLTSRLEAKLVGAVPSGVTIEFHPEPLQGVPDEVRKLRIMLEKPGLTDVTVSFKLSNGTSDLGGRDRVHFLMRCLQGQ